MVKGEYEMTDTTKYESELKAANKQIDELKTELEEAKDDIDGRDWYIERLKRGLRDGTNSNRVYRCCRNMVKPAIKRRVEKVCVYIWNDWPAFLVLFGL